MPLIPLNKVFMASNKLLYTYCFFDPIVIQKMTFWGIMILFGDILLNGNDEVGIFASKFYLNQPFCHARYRDTMQLSPY